MTNRFAWSVLLLTSGACVMASKPARADFEGVGVPTYVATQLALAGPPHIFSGSWRAPLARDESVAFGSPSPGSIVCKTKSHAGLSGYDASGPKPIGKEGRHRANEHESCQTKGYLGSESSVLHLH
jgi:hypothetical protein